MKQEEFIKEAHKEYLKLKYHSNYNVINKGNVFIWDSDEYYETLMQIGVNYYEIDHKWNVPNSSRIPPVSEFIKRSREKPDKVREKIQNLTINRCGKFGYDYCDIKPGLAIIPIRNYLAEEDEEEQDTIKRLVRVHQVVINRIQKIIVEFLDKGKNGISRGFIKYAEYYLNGAEGQFKFERKVTKEEIDEILKQ